MTQIHDAYINALLADAAYVTDLNLATTPKSLTAALSPRMTPTLAKYIGDNFSVVTQVGGLGSSFDATVWKENQTGKLYISMRGTQQGSDFVVDSDLALTGNARAQLTDMICWRALNIDQLRALNIDQALSC